MAPRDASLVQLDFPQLVADLIATLSLTGTVGVLGFSDQVVPAFLIGSRGINFGGDLPAFTSAAVFNGSVSLPAANTVVVDTGALPAGTYDVFANLGYGGSFAAGIGIVSLQHRDAANVATLAVLASVTVLDAILIDHVELPLIGYKIGLNERLRVISPTTVMNRGGISCSIFVQIRPTP